MTQQEHVNRGQCCLTQQDNMFMSSYPDYQYSKQYDEEQNNLAGSIYNHIGSYEFETFNQENYHRQYYGDY